MSSDLNYIDDLLKKELGNHSIESSSADISKFSKTLNKFNFLRFSLANFNIYYLSFIIIVFVSGAVIISNENKENIKKESVIPHSDNDKNINLNDERNNSFEVQTEKHNSDQIKIPTTPDNKSSKDNNEGNNNSEKNSTTPVDQTDFTLKTDTIQKTVNIQDTVYITKKVIITDTIKTVVPDKNKNKKNK